MEPIIEPLDKDIIESELTDDKFLRNTKHGGNKLYVVSAANSPSVMREIGRLRELAFREAGGGTGLGLDIDESDSVEDGYRQLIVWNPDDREIIGGYRFIVSHGSNTKYLSSEHYFRFSDQFRKDYLPYMIELGRSFIQPKYQIRSAKGIYALDNLWDGLGALVVANPHAKYFFGKVTMYVEYNNDARNTLIYFLRKYFPDTDNLVEALYSINIDIDESKMQKIFCGDSYVNDYKILLTEIKNHGEVIPPLINAYMNLSPSMRVFGTVSNPDFGGVEETGILITISDIYLDKLNRYL